MTVVIFILPRKAQESQKEMKLLLDMYKSAPKEQRDKVQLMAAERKAKAEVVFFCRDFFLSDTFVVSMYFHVCPHPQL